MWDHNLLLLSSQLYNEISIIQKVLNFFTFIHCTCLKVFLRLYAKITINNTLAEFAHFGWFCITVFPSQGLFPRELS